MTIEDIKKYGIETKYQNVLKEIADIELTNDKSRRIRWRELIKLKNYYKRLLKL